MNNKVEDKAKDERLQSVTKCKARIYKITNMQRCPYIHEMKERLLGEQIPMEIIPTKTIPTPPPFMMDQQQLLPQQPVATVVKLNPDGYSSHTSPTHNRADRTPLMPKEPEDDFHYVHQKVYPKNAKTSLFIIMSFVYAKLLVVVCVTYVISDVVTHNIPLYYYEGFFTYLYGMSILFLLYVFCFLLQESSCCAGNEKQAVKPPPKQKVKEKEKEKEKEKKKEEEKKKKEEKERQKKEKKEKEKDKDKKNKKQDKREKFPRKMRDVVQQQAASPTYCQQEESDQPISLQWQFEAAQQQQQQQQQGAPGQPVSAQGQQQPPAAQGQQPPPPPPSAPANNTNNSGADVEAGGGAVSTVSAATVRKCKRKTTQNDHSHGSFFLRIGAIAFGLGTMIYNGLEFGVFFEVPFTSPCYMILRGVNPVLQMIFTFMQMYFIFMNSRLNIHRFKVVARFGLMHVVATNICVWIRTFVIEYLKEITNYHLRLLNSTMPATSVAPLAESIRLHNLRNANTVLGTHRAVPDLIRSTASVLPTIAPTTASTLRNYFHTTTSTAATMLKTVAQTIPTITSTTTTTTKSPVFTTPKTIPTTMWRMFNFDPVTNPTTTITTTTTTAIPSTTTSMRTTMEKMWRAFTNVASTTASTTTTTSTSTTSTTSAPYKNFVDFKSFSNFVPNDVASVAEETALTQDIGNAITSNGTEIIDYIVPQALRSFSFNDLAVRNNDTCGRVNIMGTIVQDSSPYLYPFIIEYSLIGAAVIYVMWKHIGRNPRYVTQEDLEHRLEAMLSRRAVALAQAQQQGRVDCAGASKGLFFGLLVLVGSLICLILFFVLVHHKDFGLLAIYLADVSHCALMVLSIIAIIVGFVRVRSLKFKTEETNDLNDILLRVSAFGLFLYAVFSIIAGHLNAFTKEPNLLVMITGVLAVVQVVLQLLFIADVSRRRVHLPEHDRSKPGRQVVTFLLICNVTMWIIYTFEMQKVEANPVQLEFYGFLAWAIVQRFTLPLCIFHRFHSAVTLAEIWKTSYKARLE